MKTIRVILSIVMFVFASNAMSAGKALTEAEVKALFTNKTFDGENVVKGKTFKIFSAADGGHTVKYASGKTKKGTWSVNAKGQHCVKIKRKKGVKKICKHVISMGNGAYQKFNNYKLHTHTLKNFVSGNKL